MRLESKVRKIYAFQFVICVTLTTFCTILVLLCRHEYNFIFVPLKELEILQYIQSTLPIKNIYLEILMLVQMEVTMKTVA